MKITPATNTDVIADIAPLSPITFSVTKNVRVPSTSEMPILRSMAMALWGCSVEGVSGTARLTIGRWGRTWSPSPP
jgi:hypothetical protein